MADEKKTVDFKPDYQRQVDQSTHEMGEVERRQRVIAERIGVYLELTRLKLEIDSRLKDIHDEASVKYYKDLSDNLSAIISRYFNFLVNQEGEILNIISNVRIPTQ